MTSVFVPCSSLFVNGTRPDAGALVSMTTYYFDVSGAVGCAQIDQVGEELPDDSAAWREALSQVRSVEDSLAPGGTLQMRVREDERLVFELQVSSRWVEPPVVASPSIDGSSMPARASELLRLAHLPLPK